MTTEIVNKLFTILLTTYECDGMGPLYTEWNLKKITGQTYRPIQVVVSDHSKNDEIETVVKGLDPSGIEIVYVRYTEHYGNPCANWTNALQYAKGAYINYFAMDDYLENKDSVKDVVAEFESNSAITWMASKARIQPGNKEYIPRWPKCILFENLIGGPSGVIIRDTLKHVQLSSEFIWLLDVDWYHRLSLEAGVPHIVDKIYYVNRINPAYQLTHTVCDESRRQMEYEKLFKKYLIPKEHSIE